ncbi:hypothetical protein FGIG_12290 [Fasciola gigantica]|uniref:Uncharacterized protein n=1 Tax=Fasciola gigantica TaxID=46835 RepID=A0A504YBB6_FASGI|nr:hypothetical protein FGIG_12290 [Fasciola gigantica]
MSVSATRTEKREVACDKEEDENDNGDLDDKDLGGKDSLSDYDDDDVKQSRSAGRHPGGSDLSVNGEVTHEFTSSGPRANFFGDTSNSHALLMRCTLHRSRPHSNISMFHHAVGLVAGVHCDFRPTSSSSVCSSGDVMARCLLHGGSTQAVIRPSY